MHETVTVVLPMHNAEHVLHHSVKEVLELADSFLGNFSVMVVDNGSTDETYEAACELGRIYPQVCVLRQSVQQGLNKVLEMVRDQSGSERVIIHDGVTPIDVDQLRALLQSTTATTEAPSIQPRSESSSASRRFGSLRTLHNRMEQVHGSVSGFRWMQTEKPLIPRRCTDITPTTVLTAMPNFPGAKNTGELA